MYRKVVRKINGISWLLGFLYINYVNSLKIKKIESTCHEKISIKACSSRYRESAFNLYLLANNARKIGVANYIVWRFLFNKLCFVAVNEHGVVEGIAFYYFNVRDIKDKTVHQAFTGVSEDSRGKGIATLLRKSAISQFSTSGIGGISSRVSKNNIPSLKVNLKLGFKPVEEYFDPAMQEERYYLICRFEDNYEK